MDPKRPIPGGYGQGYGYGQGQGIPGFHPGFAPGTFKKMFYYFTIPIAIGFALYNITNKWNEPINEEVVIIIK